MIQATSREDGLLMSPEALALRILAATPRELERAQKRLESCARSFFAPDDPKGQWFGRDWYGGQSGARERVLIGEMLSGPAFRLLWVDRRLADDAHRRIAHARLDASRLSAERRSRQRALGRTSAAIDCPMDGIEGGRP